MANRRFTSQFLYQFEVMPVLLSCNFVVDSTNGNGLGIRSLKGEGIDAVYMHTSASPAPGNPNPVSGVILVELSDPYARYLGGFSGFVAPVLGAPQNHGFVGTAMIIVNLGTATLAQWQASGLPVGITPAVGVSYIPTSAGVIGGGAQVDFAGTSNINAITVVGDPNLTIAGGKYIILQTEGGTTRSIVGTTHNTTTTIDGLPSSQVASLKPGQLVLGPGIPEGTTIVSIDSSTSITVSNPSTASATVTLVFIPSDALLAPTNGSVCGLSFYLSNSSSKVKGQ